LVQQCGRDRRNYSLLSRKIWQNIDLDYAVFVICKFGDFFLQKNQTKVDWQFFIADANIKLKQLYPSILD